MGFFSWKTQDTHRSIPNRYSNHSPFPVIMTDDKGNQWREDDYEGYGDFGGKDYYELLSEMNNLGNTRDGFFDKFFSLVKDGNHTEADKWAATLIYPSLSECGKYYDGVEPERCEFQGYFYPDDDWDEDD